MTVVDRVCIMMETEKIRQIDLSNRLGISTAYANQIAKKKVETIGDRLIDDISAEFGYEKEWLLNGTGPMKKEPSREDEIAKLAADVFKSEPDSFKSRLISVLANLTTEEWKVLENVAEKLAQKKDQV